jgi:RNA polymerase primary sigma factor
MGGGFKFRYRMSGGVPSIRQFLRGGAGPVRPGDMVAYTDGGLKAASVGDECLLGGAVEARADRTFVSVISDADAVYGVADAHDRLAGEKLDVAGPSGDQGVSPGHEDFEVVVECSAAEETLVRIRLGRHCQAFSVPLVERPHAGLAPDRERELVAAAAAGDQAACAQLVEYSLPAIAGIARLYRGAANVERAELLQEGVVGLLRALRRFDPTMGTPFWGYASWWVRQAMQQLVSEVGRPAVLSDRAQRLLAQLTTARSQHIQTHGREPSAEVLSAESGIPADQVESLLAVELAPRTLDEPFVGDAISDPVADEEYERIIDGLEIDEVRSLAEGLDDRERGILYDHYGVGRPQKTLREIGTTLGVSAERVRQIEESTLSKLRTAIIIGTFVP